MSYRLERDETVIDGLVRIARHQARKAATAIVGARGAREGLHEARTSIKKLRALLRLVRPALGRGIYEKEDERLRTLGKRLSELRDATVLIETCDTLGSHIEKALRPPLQRARHHLVGCRSQIEIRTGGPRWRHRTASAFRKVRRRSQQWMSRREIDGGWDAIRGGLGRVYRHGRIRLEAAFEDGDAEAFHTWRRAVKYHRYHISLLANVWPDEMRQRLEALGELGQLLGADHDLSVLSAQLRADAASLGDNVKLRLLLRRMAQRQRALRARARILGRALYADPTSVFCRRLHRHWRIWRHDEGALVAVTTPRLSGPTTPRTALPEDVAATPRSASHLPQTSP